MDSTSSSTYSQTSFNGDLESLSEEDYFRYIGQYDCPCIGSAYGCPAMTNGTQYCYKFYCPYEDEANKNDVFKEESNEESNEKSNEESNEESSQESKKQIIEKTKKEIKKEVKEELKNKFNRKVKSHSI